MPRVKLWSTLCSPSKRFLPLQYSQLNRHACVRAARSGLPQQQALAAHSPQGQRRPTSHKQRLSPPIPPPHPRRPKQMVDYPRGAHARGLRIRHPRPAPGHELGRVRSGVCGVRRHLHRHVPGVGRGSRRLYTGRRGLRGRVRRAGGGLYHVVVPPVDQMDKIFMTKVIGGRGGVWVVWWNIQQSVSRIWFVVIFFYGRRVPIVTMFFIFLIACLAICAFRRVTVGRRGSTYVSGIFSGGEPWKKYILVFLFVPLSMVLSL